MLYHGFVAVLTERRHVLGDHDRVRMLGALALLVATSSPAGADDSSLYERLWPSVPSGRGLSLEQQITDHLTAMGNTLGFHLDQLSNDVLALTFDGRRRLAKIRFGTHGSENERYLTFRVDSDVHFTEGKAKVTARLELGIAGHMVHLELPDFEMAPAEYRGDRGVEIRMPLFKRAF